MKPLVWGSTLICMLSILVLDQSIRGKHCGRIVYLQKKRSFGGLVMYRLLVEHVLPRLMVNYLFYFNEVH